MLQGVARLWRFGVGDDFVDGCGVGHLLFDNMVEK
jgi:hypothetical protein